jgi:hypothetical protein
MKSNEEAIAFCGLCCEDCFSYQGKVADLARDLRKELRGHRFDLTASSLAELPFFKEFGNYEKCYKVLGAMVKLRCKKYCRNGGGNPFCAIQKCCEKKNFKGCWECGDFTDCKKMDFLKNNHGDAHIKNLRKIKKIGTSEFIEGKRLMYSKIKKK